MVVVEDVVFAGRSLRSSAISSRILSWKQAISYCISPILSSTNTCTYYTYGLMSVDLLPR